MKRGATLALMGMLALPQMLCGMQTATNNNDNGMPGLRLLLSAFDSVERARFIRALDNGFFQARVIERMFTSERGKIFARRMVELQMRAVVPGELLECMTDNLEEQMTGVRGGFEQVLPLFIAVRDVVGREDGVGYEGNQAQTLVSLYFAGDRRAADIAEAIDCSTNSPDAVERIIEYQMQMVDRLEKGVERWYRGYISDDEDDSGSRQDQ